MPRPTHAAALNVLFVRPSAKQGRSGRVDQRPISYIAAELVLRVPGRLDA
jgi:hypothetical protein